MAPKFWIELRRLTMTFLRDIASAPMARLTVTIMGSISGVRPTATATANRSAPSQSRRSYAVANCPAQRKAGVFWGTSGDRLLFDTNKTLITRFRVRSHCRVKFLCVFWNWRTAVAFIPSKQ
jgi:hypothetical protein